MEAIRAIVMIRFTRTKPRYVYPVKELVQQPAIPHRLITTELPLNPFYGLRPLYVSDRAHDTFGNVITLTFSASECQKNCGQTTMIQHTTRLAVYSGFTLSPDDFKMLVKTVCPTSSAGADTLENYTTTYNRWRRGISKSDRHRVPRPKLLFKPGYDITSGYDNTVEKLFFPVRWVPYEGDYQLEFNDRSEGLWTPNDTDKAKLSQFGKFVASQPGCHGFSLPDQTHFGFMCIKDLHPVLEWKD